MKNFDSKVFTINSEKKTDLSEITERQNNRDSTYITISNSNNHNIRQFTPNINKSKIKSAISSISIQSSNNSKVNDNEESSKQSLQMRNINKKSSSESKSIYHNIIKEMNDNYNIDLSKINTVEDEENGIKSEIKMKTNELIMLNKTLGDLTTKLLKKRKTLNDKKYYYEKLSSSNTMTFNIIKTKFTSISKGFIKND